MTAYRVSDGALERHSGAAQQPRAELKSRWSPRRTVLFCLLTCGVFWSGLATCVHAGEVNCQQPKFVAAFRCDFPRVVDADTLACSSGERVRLWGIDGPERGMSGAEEATRVLINLTRERIECRMTYRDKYRRAVAMCYNSKGEIGAQLISVAPVKDYPRYSRGYYGPACWGGWR